MRGLAAAFLLSSASLGAAQAIVISPKPDKVAVTVYRDPNGSGEMDLGWLNGFALVSETRMVDLPAGESELRFEGVAGGLPTGQRLLPGQVQEDGDLVAQEQAREHQGVVRQ